MKNEQGSSLIETIVAMGLLGIIGVSFLSAVATGSSSRLIADEHASARILAESQMENLKQQDYAYAYDPIPIPDDYPGYSSIVAIDNIRNGNIQKISVTIRHHNKDITELEGYKANR